MLIAMIAIRKSRNGLKMKLRVDWNLVEGEWKLGMEENGSD